jgi:hypothetical protein
MPNSKKDKIKLYSSAGLTLAFLFCWANLVVYDQYQRRLFLVGFLFLALSILPGLYFVHRAERELKRRNHLTLLALAIYAALLGGSFCVKHLKTGTFNLSSPMPQPAVNPKN